MIIRLSGEYITRGIQTWLIIFPDDKVCEINFDADAPHDVCLKACRDALSGSAAILDSPHSTRGAWLDTFHGSEIEEIRSLEHARRMVYIPFEGELNDKVRHIGEGRGRAAKTPKRRAKK